MKQTITKLLGGALLALFLMPSSARATVTAKWDWQNNTPATIRNSVSEGTDVSGSIASDVEGITLDYYAKVGGAYVKLQYVSGQDYAQFNANTAFRIPVVSTSDKITIKTYSGQHNYTFDGVAATEDDHTYDITADQVTAGYVEIVSTAYMNIYSVSVTLAYMPPVKYAMWNFTGNSAAALAIKDASGTSANVDITANGIDLTVNAHGATMGDNNNSIYTGKGATFHVPVSSVGDIVTIEGYPSYCEYTVGGGEKTTATKTIYYATSTDVTNKYVEIVNCIDNSWSYLVSISLEKANPFTTATIGSTGWATFSNTNATDFTNLAGVVDAYQVTGNSGSAITKSAVSATAAANTGLLLNAAAGTYAIPLTTTGTDLSATNKLVAVASSTAVGAAPDGYTNFVLVGGSGTASFKKITGTNSATVGAGKAYLQLAGTSFESNLFFMDDATAINAVKSNAVENGTYYNLAGQRVVNPTKGLYIVNGKKVVVK